MTHLPKREWVPTFGRERVDEDLRVELADFFERLVRRPRWHQQAACRGMGPADWFPHSGRITKAAQALCAGCPVKAECGAAAEADPTAAAPGPA